MSTFAVKCPKCGIELAAEKKHLGIWVSCESCGHEFDLWMPEDSLEQYQNMLEEFKPSIVAKAGLPISFQSPLFTRALCNLLLTNEGTKGIFHFSYPLLRPQKKGTRLQGEIRYWKDPVIVFGKPLLICKEWHDYNRKILIFWLRQMGIGYNVLLKACRSISEQTDSSVSGKRDETRISSKNKNILSSVVDKKPPFVSDAKKITDLDVARNNNTPLKSKENDTIKDIDEAEIKNDATISVPVTPESPTKESPMRFEKRLDYSVFTTGIVIPVASHKAFLSHLSKTLLRGVPRRISFLVQGKTYQAYMRNIANAEEKDCLMFIWRSTPLAHIIQTVFCDAFNMLKEDRKKKNTIFDSLIISCGDNPDEFALDFSRKNDEIQISQRITDIESCVDNTISPISPSEKKIGAEQEENARFEIKLKDVPLKDLCSEVIVPVESSEAFILRLNKPLPCGAAQQIKILFQGCSHQALIYNPQNSLSLKIYWTDTSLPHKIEKLGLSMSDTMILSCGNKPKEFILDFAIKHSASSPASNVEDVAPVIEKTILSVSDSENKIEAESKELASAKTEETFEQPEHASTIQEECTNLSDDTLLETVLSLLYQKNLIKDEVFRKIQTTYYCLRNFGTMEPVIQRLYPFMSSSDYSAHYKPWITTKDGIQFLILKKCNGLRRKDLLRWAGFLIEDVEKQKLNPDDLCKELHCSREVLGISMPQPVVTATVEASQVIPESKDIVARQEIPETEEKDTQISWTDGETEGSEEDNSFSGKCGSILNKSFVRGFILNSPISNKRFRSFWENMYGEECSYSDESIQQTMKAIGVEFDGRIYAPAQLASPDVFDEIKQYIEQLFNDGKPVIYYQALFDEFSKRHVDWKINSPEMLKSFLAAQACPYPLLRSCLAKSRNVDVSPASEIREYLKEQQEPVNYDKLQSALPHIPLDVIKHELATNTEFVNAARGEYMHADIVDLSSDDLDVIANMIQTEIHSKGFMTGTELWEKLEIEHPEYTVRYSHLPLIGFRDALKHKFVGRFNFKGNIISSVEEPIGMADIFAGFCSRRESFHLQDIEQLCDDAGILAPGPYLDAVYENSIRISQDDFVSLNSISFDVQATDDAIARFCTGDFIAITEITSFAAFPSIGVPWTSFLVESFVFKYSKKFKLYHNQFSAKVCAGAIVRNEAKLFDYHQVLASVIAKSDCRLASGEALDYLCNAGFLGRRRYSEIDIVLSEARQLRSQKG